MAFNKRTWKGRQGTGLNKFSIDGATPVTVINQPDSVTEQGDALSAGNLNDLEDRIYDAFDDIADGTQIVGKATADASGNVITTTYATKSELTSEATARANADSNLLSAIQGNSQRIENLEVAVSGSLVQTNILTDPPSMANVRTITNANEILPWAILKRVGARAVSWNQLQYNGNFASSDGWDGGTVSDGHIEASESAGNYSRVKTTTNNPAIIQGHVYFVSAKMKAISGLASGNTTYNLRINGVYSSSEAIVVSTTSIPDGTTVTLSGIFTANASHAGTNPPKYWGCYNNMNAHTVQWSDCTIFDLTAMDMASLTADQFRTLFPASYYPYNAGEIIPLNPSAFKVVGWNKWDEEWENGTVSTTTGQLSDNANKIRSKNYILVLPSTVYFFKPPATASGLNLAFYDADKNFISGLESDSNNSYMATTPTNCRYVKFSTFGTSTTTYNHDICINISQPDTTKPLHDGVYKAYSDTTLDTSFTSDYKYVNPSCHDYSENVLVDGVMRRKDHDGIVSSLDLGRDLIWNYSNGVFYSEVTIGLAKGNGIKMLCGRYQAIANVAGLTAAANNADKTICGIIALASGDRVYLKDSSLAQSDIDMTGKIAKLEGVILNYESSNPPAPTLSNVPIPNFPCEDGTTITAVTPQTDLVNSIDVPSTIAYMTKNAS